MGKERLQSRFYERSLDVCKVAIVVSWVLLLPNLMAAFVMVRSFYHAQSAIILVGIGLGLLGMLRYPVVGSLAILFHLACFVLTPSVNFGN